MKKEKVCSRNIKTETDFSREYKIFCIGHTKFLTLIDGKIKAVIECEMYRLTGKDRRGKGTDYAAEYVDDR